MLMSIIRRYPNGVAVIAGIVTSRCDERLIESLQEVEFEARDFTSRVEQLEFDMYGL